MYHILWVWGQPSLHRDFQASQVYMVGQKRHACRGGTFRHFLFNQFCLLSEMGYYCVTQSCSDWTQTHRSSGPPASGFINSWNYEHMQSYALKKKLKPHLLIFRYGMRPWHRPTWLVFWLPVHRPSQLQKSPDLFCLSPNRLIWLIDASYPWLKENTLMNPLMSVLGDTVWELCHWVTLSLFKYHTGLIEL